MSDPIIRDLEAAEKAYARVQAELEALPLGELAPSNVDVVTATSVALGAADRIRTYRDRISRLAEFDIRHVDNLTDYAKAAWYAYVSNLPVPEPADAELLIKEVGALRAKMMMWAQPLVGAGIFDQAAYDRIREGSGAKDAPSDVVALVGLYRSKWDQVKNMCGVTEQDLSRGAEIGPAVFALISRRENQLSSSASDGTLRARRAWTLLDRAYAQCRRVLYYLIDDDEEVDRIAPSLRRNAGPRASAQAPSPPPPAPAPAPSLGGAASGGVAFGISAAASSAAASAPGGAPIGGSSAGPFVAHRT